MSQSGASVIGALAISSDKEQTLPDTPPNRFVDLGGYIKWFMDKEGRRTFNDPATMGLVLRMQEWEKIVSALSEVSSAKLFKDEEKK